MTQTGTGSPALMRPPAIKSIQMMPMVFCASLPPWPRLYIEADNSCRRRNHLSMRRGVVPTVSHETMIIISAPSTKPNVGDSTMKITTLINPAGIKAPVPALATAEPTRPPIKACEEDDGMPKYQVTKFQNTAPNSAPKTTYWSTISAWMVSLPTVAATVSGKMMTAMKLNNAAMATAVCGFNTRVETMVAMALAASWKPFMKSNSSAR